MCREKVSEKGWGTVIMFLNKPIIQRPEPPLRPIAAVQAFGSQIIVFARLFFVFVSVEIDAVPIYEVVVPVLFLQCQRGGFTTVEIWFRRCIRGSCLLPSIPSSSKEHPSNKHDDHNGDLDVERDEIDSRECGYDG